MENIEKFMNEALEKANRVNLATRKYEIAKTSIEMLETNDRKLVLIAASPAFGSLSGGFNLDCPDDLREEITQMLKAYYENAQKKAFEEIRSIFGTELKTEGKEEEQTKTKKEHKSIINEEFDAVVDEMIKSMDEETKKTIVAPVQQKRIFSKNLIDDETLKKEFFDNGKTVKEIEAEYGVSWKALYKRLDKIRDREDLPDAKECARRRREKQKKGTERVSS